MKKRINRYIAIAVASVIAFSLSSCEDWLDKRPDDQNTIDLVFESKTSMERWLAYIYNAMPNFFTYDGPDAVADDMQPSVGWESQGFSAILYQQGNWTPLKSGVISYWTTFPRRIRQAYIFIDKAHPIPDVFTIQDIDRMKAECRFFIAAYHSMMLMAYGAIPKIEDATPVLEGESLMLKQRPFDEMARWCASELYEASKILPAIYDDDIKYGRATSIMCLALRARVLLFAASDLVNGTDDPKMAAMVNCDGEPIFNTTYDPEKWRTAFEAAKELIDAAEAAGHKLYVEYLPNSSTDIDPFLSYQNALMKRRNQGNLEIIYPRPQDDGSWLDRQCNPRSMGGAGAIGVTQLLVDAFFMRNGLVPITGYTNNGKDPIINTSSGYSEADASGKPLYTTAAESYPTAYSYASAAGSATAASNIIVPANTFKMYGNREPRFYISVLYNEQWHYGKSKNSSTTANPATNYFLNGPDGGPSHDSPSAGYLARKRIDPTWTSNSATYGNNRHGSLYRLAEAYLSYAEALMEYSMDKGTYATNKGEILKYINMIRERAGIPMYGDGPGMIAAPTNEAQMLDLIRRERRVELNCENGLRFADLRRWELAADVLDGRYYGMNMNQEAAATNRLPTQAERDKFYVRTPYQTRTFKSYWWPIPQNEIDVNTNLRQLPGWN